MDKPHLIMAEGRLSLMVDGRPFLVLGGEVHNSSASSLDYMAREVWPSVRNLNLNTLIVPVSWELLEPEPGRFDFTIPDGLIEQARREGVKLVLLWFGLWKNGISSYVPGWMKADPDTYFNMRDRWGKALPAVSPLCSRAVERDAKAFSALLSHLKSFDKERTVIMVQVENEMGLLGECRDFSEEGRRAYESPVPPQVTQLTRKSGAWQEAFGDEAPELFMTYSYASATERIARAGRMAYHLPMYVNAWLEQYPWYPGSYPTGGPIARHMDFWKAFAPSVDFIAPDIYLPDFEKVCGEYTAGGNPLFIPEARPCMDSASNIFAAFGEYGALGFSPFAIESITKEVPPPDPALMAELNIMAEAFYTYRSGEYLAESYRLLGGMLDLIQKNRGTGRLHGFTEHANGGTLVRFQNVDFLISYTRRDRESPKGGGLILELSENRYLLCGLNFTAVPRPKYAEPGRMELISVTEGRYESGRWEPCRRLNGDELGLRLGPRPQALMCEVQGFR